MFTHNRSLAIVVLAILLGVALLAACQPVPLIEPTPTATPRPTDTPTPLPTPTAAPQATPAMVQDAGDQSAPSVEAPVAGQPFKTVMSEAQVNDLIQGALTDQADLPVSDVYLKLNAGSGLLTAKATLGALTLDLGLVTTATAKDGKVDLKVTEVQMGGQTAPALVRNQVMSMIQPYIDQYTNSDLGAEIDDVQITPGELVVTGKYK